MSDQWLLLQVSYYILVSMEIPSIRTTIRVENQYDYFVKIMQERTVCFNLFRFYIHFIRRRSLDRAAKLNGRFTQNFHWRLCSLPEFPHTHYRLSLLPSLFKKLYNLLKGFNYQEAFKDVFASVILKHHCYKV